MLIVVLLCLLRGESVVIDYIVVVKKVEVSLVVEPAVDSPIHA
jgi:hypothetical protein